MMNRADGIEITPKVVKMASYCFRSYGLELTPKQTEEVLKHATAIACITASGKVIVEMAPDLDLWVDIDAQKVEVIHYTEEDPR